MMERDAYCSLVTSHCSVDLDYVHRVFNQTWGFVRWIGRRIQTVEYILRRGHCDPWISDRLRKEGRLERVEEQVHLLACFLHRSVCRNPFQQWPCSGGECRATVSHQPQWFNTSTWFFSQTTPSWETLWGHCYCLLGHPENREFDQEVIKPHQRRGFRRKENILATLNTKHGFRDATGSEASVGLFVLVQKHIRSKIRMGFCFGGGSFDQEW